jgi:hypothetical protein
MHYSDIYLIMTHLVPYHFIALISFRKSSYEATL